MSKASRFDIDTTDFLPSQTSYRSDGPSDMKLIGRRQDRSAAKIQVDRIIARSQVRQSFDEEELQELADSIRSKGQLQPIRVWWDEEAEDGGRYVILQGERRFRAAQMAGLVQVDCVVHEGRPSDAEITELQLIENIIRSQLNPIEEAMAFKKIMSDRKAAGVPATFKDLARETGFSETKVQRSVRLLTLPEEVQNDVAQGIIPPTVIREVLKLKDEEAQRELIQSYKEGGTREQIAAIVREQKTGGARRISESAGPKTKKVFSSGLIKLQATSNKRVSQAQIVEALQEWIEILKNDGRSKAA